MMRISLLQMGLSASALILLTALLRLCAGRRLPRRMFVALWDVATLRLLLPFAFPVRLFAKAAKQAPLSDAVRLLPRQIAFSGVVSETVDPSPAASPVSLRLSSLLPGALRMIWIAGALGLALYFLLRYARCLRAFALSLPDGDARAIRFLRDHPLRRRVRIRVSDAVASPLSYGVLRPVILLPLSMDRRDDQALSFVLLHELFHIRALDALRKPLLLAALCAHWMNPLTYVLLILASRDMELLCDERVLACGGSDTRRAYALTLLSMEERRSAPFPLVSGFSRTAIEERIKAMKHQSPKSAACLLTAALLVFSSCAAFATGEASGVEAQKGITAEVVTKTAVITQTASDSDKAAEKVTITSGFSIPGSAGAEAAAQDDVITFTVSDVSTQVGIVAEALSEGGYTYSFSTVVDKDGQTSEGVPFLTKESWQNHYSVYEPYGLSYDAERGRLTFDGKLVRYFEDMLPVGDEGYAGTVCSFPDGEVDIRVERDLSAPILREADGSYDPQKVYPILSISEADQEIFDMRTKEREDTQRLIEDSVATGATSSVAQSQETSFSGVYWWTAESYREWMEKQREEMQELVDSGAMAYTQADGWFVWTQEKVDEAMALYEQILGEIERGASYGTIDDGMIISGNAQK